MYSEKTYKRLSLVMLAVCAIMVFAALISGLIEFWLGAIAGFVSAISSAICAIGVGGVSRGEELNDANIGLLDGAQGGLPKHNPANGLDMLDGNVDVHGNPYGINS